MKELIQKITESWQRECLESIFSDEDIFNLRRDEDDTEYEIECVLRRVKPKE